MSAIKEKDKKYNLHSWSAQNKVDPIVVTKAEGLYFWDENGKKYADMSSQLVNSNLGHGNKAIIDAIIEQAQKIPFMGPAFAMDCRADAAEAVVEATGFKGGKVFFTNAGAEANENAIKIARQYTGKLKIFSQYRCYHGSTAGAGMLTGEPSSTNQAVLDSLSTMDLTLTEHLRLASSKMKMMLLISTSNCWKTRSCTRDLNRSQLSGSNPL